MTPLEAHIVSLSAWVDQAKAEYDDPSTPAWRKQVLVAELRRLYNVLIDAKKRGA